MRSFDKEEQTLAGNGLDLRLSGYGGERKRDDIASPAARDFVENRRELVAHRAREYWIRPSEIETLRAIGTFRVVRNDDIVVGVHGGSEQLGRADLAALRRQELVSSVTCREVGDERLRLHTLTRAGRDLIEAIGNSPQEFHYGFVKPSEVGHDSLMYRAFLCEEADIRLRGGTVRRVVLEIDLKRAHYRRINKPGVNYESAQRDSAQELGLSVLDGHVVLPDFRIEYVDGRGDLGRVDVEVATGNYRESHLAAKVAAGFRLYSPNGGLAVSSSHPLKGNAFPRENRSGMSL